MRLGTLNFLKVQSNLSTTATLKTEEIGRYGEVAVMGNMSFFGGSAT